MSTTCVWRAALCAVLMAVALALFTLPALADDAAKAGGAGVFAQGEATGGGSSPESADGDAGALDGAGDDGGGSGDDSASADPHPDRQEGDVFDGEIIDYNTEGLTLSISMESAAVTLKVGDSASVSCIVDPHTGILHTEKNGDFMYDASAFAVSSDPSVVRATYDLGSDTLYIEAVGPGAATITVNATLVYASPVSASVDVTVPEPEAAAGLDDEYVAGVPGGQGNADTNVANGTGAADYAHLTTGTSGAASYNVPDAAAAAGGAQAPTVTMPELQAAPEVQAGMTLYELEEVEPAVGYDVADNLTAGFVFGVGIAALALVALGGGETYASFRRRLA